MTHPTERLSKTALFLLPAVIALLAMLGPFSIDTPFPAFSAMAEEFDVASTQMQLIVTVYMAAFAAMSIFHGPLSDAIGRRPVMAAACLVYAVASVGAALSPDLTVLLIFRALQGLSAGGATIVSRTVVRDLYDGAEAQRMMSRVIIIFSIAPAIAPVVGGLLLQLGSWHLLFWFMALMGLLLVSAIVLMLPESHPPEARTPLQFREILRGLNEVIRVPDFHRVAWAMTFGFGAQFLYIGGAAIFVGELLGQGELDYWKFFVPLVAGLMLGGSFSSRMAGHLDSYQVVTLGMTWSAVMGAVGVGIAFAAGPTLPWAIIGPALIAAGVGAAYPNQNLLLLDVFPQRRGAVMSAGTFTTLMFNAVAAITITPLVGQSVETFAVGAWVLVMLGLALWLWHRRTMAERAAIVRKVD